MPIRSRGQYTLTPPLPTYEGRKYPGPRFTGYAMRFGKVTACFDTPKMQAVSDSSLKHLRHVPGDAAILYMTRFGVERELHARNEIGADEGHFRFALDNWPVGPIPRGLYDPFHSYQLD